MLPANNAASLEPTSNYMAGSMVGEHVVLETKPKRTRKPRKKKAQLIDEAYDKGVLDGISQSTGGLATLIFGTAMGSVGTLIFIALYHFAKTLR